MSYALFKHQQDAAPLLMRRSAILWWDTQTGKTRAVLHAFDQLWQAGGPRHLVVVCPAYARATWVAELEEMKLALPVRNLYGVSRRYSVDSLRPGRVHVDQIRADVPSTPELPHVSLLSWDVVGAWEADLRGQMGSAVLVLDESHEHAVNPATRRYKGVQSLALYSARTWLLSGTLYRRTAMDIFWQARLTGQLRNLKPAAFGDEYCQRRFNPFRGYSGNWEYRGLKPGAENKLGALITNLSRVHEEDCYDVPAIRRLVRWVDIGAGYDGGDNETHMETARTRLVPIKIQRCLEFIHDLPQRPLVVFGWHQSFVEAVAEAIPGAAFITGNTPPIQRAEIRRRFMAGQIPVLVANLKAFGLSVSLTRASHVIFGELHWSETDHRQAEGRIKGPSQASPHITYTYLGVRNSVDDFVWRVKLDKGRAIDRLDRALTQRIVIQAG